MSRAAAIPLVLLVCLAGPGVAHPGAYGGGGEDRPARRWLAEGGISLPLSFSLGSYDVGGGAGLGVEFPQSDVHSFVVRAGFDHMNETRYEFGSDNSGSADIGTLRAGVRFQRRREGWRSEYSEAAFGGGYERLSTRVTDGLTGASRLDEVRGGGWLFAVGFGISARTEAPLGFFLDTHLFYLFANHATNQFATFRLGFSLQ